VVLVQDLISKVYSLDAPSSLQARQENYEKCANYMENTLDYADIYQQLTKLMIKSKQQ